jgi:hypothetical protein
MAQYYRGQPGDHLGNFEKESFNRCHEMVKKAGGPTTLCCHAAEKQLLVMCGLWNFSKFRRKTASCDAGFNFDLGSCQPQK